MEETGVGSNGTEPPGGESEGIKGQLFSTSQKTTNDPMMESSKDQEESTSRTLDSRSCPSELLRDFFEKARGTQEHIAGCRCEKTLCVSVSNHPSRKRPVHGNNEALHHEQGEAGEIGAQ